MTDPLAEVVVLLRPSAAYSKVVHAGGPWRVRRTEVGRPFYCVVLDGACRLAVGGHDPVTLQAGDFALIPSANDFTVASLTPPTPGAVESVPIEARPGVFHLGGWAAEPDVRMVVGYCAFGSTDADLLVSLLPQLVHVRGEGRLLSLAQLVDEESHGCRPARDTILARLIEVLLIEALRSTTGPSAAAGLLRGLGDRRLAIALRRLHESPTSHWTVDLLAKEASLSRSAFFERFKRAVGVAPMEYLLRWRMTLAKELLRRSDGGVAEVAENVGYSSASTFSVAFTRHVGRSPAAYARAP